MMVRTLAVLVAVVIIILIVVVTCRRRRHHPIPGPDNYTLALPLSLMFFDAQRCTSLFLHASFYLLICINKLTNSYYLIPRCLPLICMVCLS